MYALIENKPDGKYVASLIGWPDVTAQGETEDEALAELRQSLTRHLKRGRIVPLEFDSSPSDNPWLQLGETFKDNPLLDEVTRSIEEYRRQFDTVEEDS
jgi:predicted RNase H-like HicB family nuclease